MSETKRRFILILIILVITSNVFWLTPQAQAVLTIPTTLCDTQWSELSHIQNPITQEDGTKAFKYGPDNNAFVTVSGNDVTFKVDLLFTPPATALFKVFAFNASCTAFYGDTSPVVVAGLNTIIYNKDTNKVQFNTEDPSSVSGGIPKYLGFDVWDGVPTNDNKSYSYLVEIDNTQNPTGSTGSGGGGGGPAPGASDPTGNGGIYDQTQFYADQQPQGPRPVLIIPGIVGTDLFYNRELVWLNAAKMLEEPNDHYLTQALSLDETGESIKSIETGDIIRNVEVSLLKIDIFKKLIELFEEKNFTAEKTYFTFRYDWRLDLNKTSESLKKRVEEIKALTKHKKIDVVAHSMGGLVAKNYIKDFGEQDINKLIFVGTPHLGAPKAAKVLLAGDQFSIPWLDADRIQEIARNAPAIYQLLPNRNYFESLAGYILPNGTDAKILDYNQTQEFLAEHELNKSLIQKTEQFFGKELHEMKFSEVDAYNIAGCKTGTQAQYSFGLKNSYIRDINYVSGDKTVPLVSADYINLPSDHKFYVKNGNHAELSSTEGVRDLIVAILSDKSSQLSENVSNNSDFCRMKGKTIIWRSPVKVHVYDANGNHTGPKDLGIENNIPGVDYEIIGEEKFMFLPDEGNYHVEALGRALGHFDLSISDVDDDVVTNTTVFNDVAITQESKIKFDVNPGIKVLDIAVDYSGSGEFKTVEPDATLTPQQLADSTPPVTQIDVKDLDGNLKEITFQATDDNSGVLEIRYSLDGSSEQIYQEAIVIPATDIKNFQYYAVDKAGNNEETRILELKVLGKSIDVNFIPDGTLVLDESDGRTIYMIGNNGKKYGFISESAFKKLGYRFNGIIKKDLSSQELGGFVGSEFDHHPNGSLIKSGDTIWWINFDKRFVVTSMDVFNHCKFRLDNVVEANATDMTRPEYILEKSFCN